MLKAVAVLPLQYGVPMPGRAFRTGAKAREFAEIGAAFETQQCPSSRN